MKIIYIISGYKLPEQLIRLVNRIKTNDSTIIIHIDKKTGNRIYRRILEALHTYDNVYFLDRHVCNYGDFGHVKATLKGIQKIITLNIPGDYIILLTGQDYPIKSNREIQRFMNESKDQSFIEYFPLPSSEHWNGNGGLDRVAHFHFYFRNHHISIPNEHQFKSHIINRFFSILSSLIPFRREIPGGLKLYGGSSYWCLSRDCIEYIYKFVQQNSSFVNFFKHVSTPDEIFFQTIILNSTFKDHLVNRNLRYIDWSKPDPPYPAILRKLDFERFIVTDNLFARKFDISIDEEILDMIDRRISTRY